MPWFIKKPIAVDAVQWFPGNGCRGVSDDFPTDPAATRRLCGCVMFDGNCAGSPHVHPTRLPTGVRIEPGDWIIREMDGSGYYPCKDDVFRESYDPVPPDGKSF